MRLFRTRLLSAFIFLFGVFIVGILGVVFMVLGITLSHLYFGSDIGITVLVGTILMLIIAFYYALTQETWAFIASRKNSTLDADETPVEVGLILGQEGLTLSALRPIGTAQFGNDSFEVRTFGKYLDNNSIVYIAKIDRRKIYVKAIESFKAS